MFKRLMQSRAVASLLGFFIASYMTFVKYTTRWEVIGAEHAAPIIKGGKGFIAATWHSRFLMLTSAWQKSYQQPSVLISRSREGEIVARASHLLGLKTIRGSARRYGKKAEKGGANAFREMRRAIEDGGCMVITPDGPKGPRQRAGDGPFLLAKHSGAPLISCVFSTRFRKQLNSWDRFIVPLPFGRGQIIWGQPVHITPDTDDAELAALKMVFENEMNANLAAADRAMGHAPTLPEETREDGLPKTSRGSKAKI